MDASSSTPLNSYCLPCCGPVEVVDELGQAGWGLGELVDEAAQFAGAGAGRRRQDGERAKPGPRVVVDGGEEHADLLGG
jgi:hypothetical protein